MLAVACVLSAKRTHYVMRYVGHANVQTDIKARTHPLFLGSMLSAVSDLRAQEAAFWGDFVVSGSDDGKIFIWFVLRKWSCLARVAAAHRVLACMYMLAGTRTRGSWCRCYQPARMSSTACR